jgi:hypothetical protein
VEDACLWKRKCEVTASEAFVGEGMRHGSTASSFGHPAAGAGGSGAAAQCFGIGGAVGSGGGGGGGDGGGGGKGGGGGGGVGGGGGAAGRGGAVRPEAHRAAHEG